MQVHRTQSSLRLARKTRQGGSLAWPCREESDRAWGGLQELDGEKAVAEDLGASAGRSAMRNVTLVKKTGVFLALFAFVAYLPGFREALCGESSGGPHVMTRAARPTRDDLARIAAQADKSLGSIAVGASAEDAMKAAAEFAGGVGPPPPPQPPTKTGDSPQPLPPPPPDGDWLVVVVLIVACLAACGAAASAY